MAEGAAASAPAGPGDVLARLRAGAATVAGRARHVRIDEDALGRLAGTLPARAPALLPEEVPAGDADDMVAAIVAWNAVNFGSGWFPELRKRPGLSGSRTLALAFSDHVARTGAPTAEWLSRVDAATCATVFGQPHPGPVDDLLDLFARAWNDLGALLLDGAEGSATTLVASAGGSAATLVATLGAVPSFADVAVHGEGADAVEVPFHKRAQITVSHLARAFGDQGPGSFAGIGHLTAFADNLVPHVLRMAGVLAYDPHLAARIGRGDLLRPGSAEEVEIRACALHAVELAATARGVAPATVDHELWQRGQAPEIKAVPRHRCRCPWY